MRTFGLAGCCLLIGPVTLWAQGRVQPAENVARSYIAAQEALMQQKAGEAELRQVMGFLADSVVYDHPRAGAHIVGKHAIAEGMRSFLGATRNPHITVAHLVASPRVVVVEEEVAFELRDTNQWVPRSRTQVTVFEVENGRITHVVELWQPR